MAHFLIQNDDKELETEKLFILELLKRNKYVHTYEEISLKDIDDMEMQDNIIPIGTIPFVSKALKKHYDIDKENPIEIPPYLRTEEFLKRDYKIVKGSNLPRSGYYFIKNASTLKDFSYYGELSYFLYDEMFDPPRDKYDNSLRLNKDDLFVLSKAFHIESEYRVYVFDHKVEAISHYNGDPTLFPDVGLIKKAISLIQMNEPFLKSYTIDVMVNRHKGTAIIEIHNFTSCGLYSTLWGDSLLWAYRDGIDYLRFDNKKIQP